MVALISEAWPWRERGWGGGGISHSFKCICIWRTVCSPLMCLRLHDSLTVKHVWSLPDSDAVLRRPDRLLVGTIWKSALPFPQDLLSPRAPPACLGGLPCPYVSKKNRRFLSYQSYCVFFSATDRQTQTLTFCPGRPGIPAAPLCPGGPVKIIHMSRWWMSKCSQFSPVNDTCFDLTPTIRAVRNINLCMDWRRAVILWCLMKQPLFLPGGPTGPAGPGGPATIWGAVGASWSWISSGKGKKNKR